MGDQSYTISELAKEFGVTTRTIRFYEEKGYLTPQRRGQQRIYCAADRVRIKLILRGKRLGMSLAECIEIIDMYHTSGSDAAQLKALLETIANRREQLQQQLTDIRSTLANLDEVETLCRNALNRARENGKQQQTAAGGAVEPGLREAGTAGI